MRSVLAALAAVSMALGCNGVETPIACTLEARAGINVTVVDSVTSTPVADATGVAREGAFSEEFMSIRPGELFGVFERAGTYEVTVSATGYRAWRADPVRVDADECHVIPVRLTARLQPV